MSHTVYEIIYIIGQILGIVNIGVVLFTYSRKTRRGILFTKLVSDALCVVQQAMIGAFTASLVNVINFSRDIVYYYKGDKKWASHIAWLIFFLIVTSITPLFTWQGWFSVLPAIGSCIAAIGLYCTKTYVTRSLTVATMTCWIVYSCILFNPGALVASIVSIVSAVIGLFRDYKAYKQQKTRQSL